MNRRPMPPLRSCSACGREFRSFQTSACPTCDEPRRENSTALAEELRRRRIARRAELSSRGEEAQE